MPNLPAIPLAVCCLHLTLISTMPIHSNPSKRAPKSFQDPVSIGMLTQSTHLGSPILPAYFPGALGNLNRILGWCLTNIVENGRTSTLTVMIDHLVNPQVSSFSAGWVGGLHNVFKGGWLGFSGWLRCGGWQKGAANRKYRRSRSILFRRQSETIAFKFLTSMVKLFLLCGLQLSESVGNHRPNKWRHKCLSVWSSWRRSTGHVGRLGPWLPRQGCCHFPNRSLTEVGAVSGSWEGR